MRRIWVAMVLVAVSALVSLACTASPTAPTFTPLPTPTTQVGFLTFTNELIGFQISYPPSWEVDTEFGKEVYEDVTEFFTEDGFDFGGTNMIFLAGLPTREGGYLPSINIVVESVPTGMSTDEFVKLGIYSLQDIAPSAGIVEQSNIQIDNLTATLIQWEISVRDFGGIGGIYGDQRRIMQVILTRDGVGWNVACTLKHDSSPGLINTCESSVRSLKFLD